MATTTSDPRAAQVARLRAQYPLWARTCYRILTKAGTLEPLLLKSIQREIGRRERAALKAHGKARLYVLKGRQGGVSTDQQARNLHAIWAHKGRTVMTLADTRENTDKIFEVTLRGIRNFPAELLPRLGARETREIGFPRRDSRFYTATAGAMTAGRGVTIWRLHGSEFAFWKKPRQTLAAITPALVPHGSSVVLETTASGYGSEGHQFWQEAETGVNDFEPVFIPWWECDPANYQLPLMAADELGPLEPDEAALVATHGLTLEQLKWRRSMMRAMGRQEFFREYPEDAHSCWLAAGGMYFEAATLQALMLRAPEPRETLRNGTLRIFDDPKGEAVIIGADTAEGVGGDRSTFVARAFPSWRLLVEFADNTIAPDPFADLLDEWGRKLGMAKLVPEKNAHGITVIRRLRDHHRYPTTKIYHRVALDREQKPTPDTTDRIGWHTSEESKPLLLNAGYQMLEAAKERTAGPPSKACLGDAFGVRRDDNGGVKLNGKDILVADMLAWIGRGQPQLTVGGATVTF